MPSPVAISAIFPWCRAADELYVVVHHVPFYFVAAGHPPVAPYGFVAFDAHEVAALACKASVEFGGGDFDGVVMGETGGGCAHCGENDGEMFVQFVLECLEDVFLVAVDVVPEVLSLVERQTLHFVAQGVDGLAVGSRGCGEVGAHFAYFCAEFIVGELGEARAFGLYLCHYWAYGFEVAAGFVAEYFGYNAC